MSNIVWKLTDKGEWQGRFRRGYFRPSWKLELFPYDEPPKYMGYWMLRFIGVPAWVNTWPGDVDFTDAEKAKAYAEDKLRPYRAWRRPKATVDDWQMFKIENAEPPPEK